MGDKSILLLRQAKAYISLAKALKSANIEHKHYVLKAKELIKLAKRIENQEKTVILKLAA